MSTLGYIDTQGYRLTLVAAAIADVSQTLNAPPHSLGSDGVGATCRVASSMLFAGASDIRKTGNERAAEVWSRVSCLWPGSRVDYVLQYQGVVLHANLADIGEDPSIDGQNSQSGLRWERISPPFGLHDQAWGSDFRESLAAAPLNSSAATVIFTAPHILHRGHLQARQVNNDCSCSLIPNLNAARIGRGWYLHFLWSQRRTTTQQGSSNKFLCLNNF